MFKLPQNGLLSVVSRQMQTLRLSDSTPRGTDNRLKSLFWPTIRHDGDLDYIAEQGFWVCFIVATVTLVFSIITQSLFLGAFESLFYFLAGVGVRQRNKVAAITVFVAYLLGGFVLQKYMGNGFSIVRLVFLALLLSNVRGIWLSARWKKTGEPETSHVRLSKTIFDKLSDQLPALIWPKAKWIFAFIAAIEIAMMLMMLTTPMPPVAAPIR
jgi:hypothetical protein